MGKCWNVLVGATPTKSKVLEKTLVCKDQLGQETVKTMEKPSAGTSEGDPSRFWPIGPRSSSSDGFYILTSTLPVNWLWTELRKRGSEKQPQRKSGVAPEVGGALEDYDKDL